MFHFDREIISRGLAQFSGGDVGVATFPASGPSVGEIYVDAADEAALAYLFGDATSPEEYLAKLDDFITQVSALHSRYMKAAHGLLAAGLKELGCVSRDVARPAAVSDGEEI